MLFLQAGGNGQFSAIPLNLCTKLGEDVDYIVSGTWSEKAASEAEKYCKVNWIHNPNKEYKGLPKDYRERLNPNARFLYYCANETIHGIEWTQGPPEDLSPNQLLVCDMSSNFLTRPVDVSKYAVIVAGAQKNVGISGVTVVIVRDDLLNQANNLVPSVLHYKKQAANMSMLNTPPCFALYVTRLCLSWIRRQGGIDGMDRLSQAKSQLVYNAIDQSNGFYKSTVEADCRSRVNIPFRVAGGNAELEKRFLAEAVQRNMLQLKGHRSVGGMRVSLYNAINLQETQDFVDFLLDFQKRNQISN